MNMVKLIILFVLYLQKWVLIKEKSTNNVSIITFLKICLPLKRCI